MRSSLAHAQSRTHTHLMLLYDFLPCTCTILSAHTHIHTHIWCYDMISSFGQNLPMDFQAQYGKTATDQQHEKKMENVQIKQFLVKWSEHIIYEMANVRPFRTFLYIEVKGVRGAVLPCFWGSYFFAICHSWLPQMFYPVRVGFIYGTYGFLMIRLGMNST